MKKKNTLVLPTNISLVKIRNKDHFVYDLKMILKSDNFKNELKIFIDKINEKYPNLNLENIIIKNNELIEINNNIKIKLPNNFLFYKEKNKYYFQYAKHINKIKISKKITINSNNLQNELDKFIELLNNTYSDLKLDKYLIPNILSNLNIINYSQSNKPIMPQNFSITTINNIDYIQFCKKINDKRYQYKIKITSYNLQKELEKFIDSLNINYSLNLNK